MSNTPIVLGGLYRVKRNDSRNVKAGDLCILAIDDGTTAPRFHNPNWEYSRKWLSIEKVEFLGVIKNDI